MQLNVGLDKENERKADVLRVAKYPGTTKKQIRDSFLFDECIGKYTGNFELIKKYIENENDVEIVKRNITLKNENYIRLKEMAEILEKPVAPVLRALINIAVENLDYNSVKEQEVTEVNSKILKEKIALLEKKINEIEILLNEIKSVIE